ncbi:FN3 associated domain-containing protein [Paraflavitalea speifideaquila]|uniref:FN3 associated domain-containing protein n=1 Tax=Paraflavitalea speifideaquila TaxID=3076558 RepID=UPI0028EE2095|nr:FN3 associated domain-containing protein [Paraflavitalea speifideiaquila]
MYEPLISASKNAAGGLKVDLTTEIEGLDIYYSFDNSFPDRFYPKYTGTLVVPKDAVNLKLVTYKGKQQVGRQVAIPVAELVRRAERKK